MKKSIIKKVCVCLATILSVTSILSLTASAKTVTLNDTLTPQVSYNSTSKQLNYAYYTTNSSTVSLLDEDVLSGSYQGNIECYALAAFTYEGRFGSTIANHGYVDLAQNLTYDYFYPSARSFNKFINALSVGSHIRINTRDGNQHSLVLAKTNASNLNIYDANYNNDNVIHMKTYTYSNFMSRFPRIDYVHTGVAKNSLNNKFISTSGSKRFNTNSPGITASYNIDLTNNKITMTVSSDLANQPVICKLYIEGIEVTGTTTSGYTVLENDKTYSATLGAGGQKTFVYNLTSAQISVLQYIEFTFETSLGTYNDFWIRNY